MLISMVDRRDVKVLSSCCKLVLLFGFRTETSSLWFLVSALYREKETRRKRKGPGINSHVRDSLEVLSALGTSTEQKVAGTNMDVSYVHFLSSMFHAQDE